MVSFCGLVKTKETIQNKSQREALRMLQVKARTAFIKEKYKINESKTVSQTVEYSISAHHNRRVASGSQGCAREGVKGGAGVELL